MRSRIVLQPRRRRVVTINTRRDNYRRALAALSTRYNPGRTRAARNRYLAVRRRAFLAATRGRYFSGRNVPHIVRRITQYI